MSLLRTFMMMILAVSTLTVLANISETVLAEEYRGLEFCSACHPNKYSSWSNTMHAITFEDPIFQSVWSSEGKPSLCLQCHTTGFNPETGVENILMFKGKVYMT